MRRPKCRLELGGELGRVGWPTQRGDAAGAGGAGSKLHPPIDPLAGTYVLN